MRQAAGRVPLRIKLVSALLALVVIALAVISMVGLAQFRGYLQHRADAQLRALSQQIGSSSGINSLGPPAFSFEGYVVELRHADGQLVPCNQCTTQQYQPASPPDVPTAKSWLSANDHRLVTVPAVSGGDTWRVLTRPQGYYTNGLGPLPGTL